MVKGNEKGGYYVGPRVRCFLGSAEQRRGNRWSDVGCFEFYMAGRGILWICVFFLSKTVNAFGRVSIVPAYYLESES